MAVSWCPHCKLPLTPEEAQVGTCPGCRNALSGRPASPAPIVPGSRKSSGVRRLALALPLLVGVASFFALRSMVKSESHRAPDEEVSLAPPVVVDATTRKSNAASTHGTPLEGNQAPGPVAAAVATPIPTPEPIAIKPPPPAPGDVQQIDNPDGDHLIKSLSGGQVIKLAGRVNTLKIGSITGKSLLDASALQAKSILIGGVIDGASTVRLSAPNGKVEFCSPVAGGAQIEVAAPGGEIWFGPLGSSKKVTRINGQATLVLTAREVQIRGGVHGTGTRVSVTLTPGGRLRFVELAEGARLQYRKAARSDPDPDLVKGIIASRAGIDKLE